MIETRLLRAIQRSEEAYLLYQEDKKFFQALRVLKANKIIYQLLEEYLYICNESQTKNVLMYLFHLEDWFNQFDSERSNVNLDERFVFDRLEGSIAFPKLFKDTLL